MTNKSNFLFFLVVVASLEIGIFSLQSPSMSQISSQMLIPQDVIVVGSVMMDFVAYASRIPIIGETVFGETFQKNFGGKGSNQAVMIARLGGKVNLLSKLGMDSLGDEYIAQFSREGVDTNCVLRSPSTTGIACITVDNAGSNTIVIIPGANKDLKPPEIQTKDTYIANARVLICQNEIPRDVTLTALSIAKSCGTITIFNPAPADSATELSELIALSDIICPNEVELSTITGMNTATDDDVRDAAIRLLAMGPKAVVVTLGSRGAFLATEQSKTFFSAVKVNAVDTVGAGDAFIGTLALNIARASTLSEAIERALGCASDSVTRKGAQCSYPLLADLPLSLRPSNQDNVSREKAIENFWKLFK